MFVAHFGRRCLPIAITLTLAALTSTSAWADVVGRLKISVKNAADEKPVAGAKIVLKDSAKTLPDVTLTTNDKGEALSPEIEARAWDAVTQAENFQTDSQAFTVVADTTKEVEVLLEPLKETKIVIRAQRDRINRSQTNSITQRDQNFSTKFPLTGGNSQNINNLLKTVPGIVVDSVNQAHPRGEHSQTAININGFYLPGALQGRAGQLLVPSTLQSVDVLTGSYSPEYGGETAAILNLNLRSGPIRPVRDLMFEFGEFSTFGGALTFGGQAGIPIGEANETGYQPRRFGYLLDFGVRRTDNALEPPQPNRQTAHNDGSSFSIFGNFDYKLSSKDSIALTLNTTPAYTQIANRTGLPNSFAAFGQGFGYTGALSAADAATANIVSQDAAGQDVNQRDSNTFGLLNYRRAFSDRTSGLFSFGLVHSAQEIRNNNPAVNLLNLPADNSIEYNPTVIRNSRHAQFQGSVTHLAGRHTFKGGLVWDEQSGNEAYQFIPSSQLALNALAGISPQLAPAGTPQVDANNQPILDSLGNQVYLINRNNTTVPNLRVRRTGFYRAFYVQDTWNVFRRATLNYGLRLDWYKLGQNLGQATVDEAHLSPRVNFAYQFDRDTVGRFAYNRLFIQPPLAQGAVIGASIRPATLNQFDFSVERQFKGGHTAKVAYYIKDIRNQIDTALLIPGTQIGVFSAVNLQNGGVHGFEFSYELTPRNNVGMSAYATWSHTIAKPSGLTSTGEPVEPFTDHDQLNTINFGIAYTWKCGTNVGLDVTHSSGLFSSSLVEEGARKPRTIVNLGVSSGNRLFGGNRGGVSLHIENLFDDRSVINFNSPFSGSRFQQGRRIMFNINGKF